MSKEENQNPEFVDLSEEKPKLRERTFSDDELLGI